jgi:quercetin dioxygenase-like cupin family protein
MPAIVGHENLASIPEERISDKISRKVMSGKQGMMVWWRFRAGGRAAAHAHPHEQFSWMISGRMNLRIGNEERSMVAGDVAVIPGGVEHEAFFPEDTEVLDFFVPVREDFLAGDAPPYMAKP